ncbi:hypothetical protein S40285_08611 [Stachybotrys chlorohalonatus IBT 40285]|uniref:SPRY domain-containing protein n=1 Tax=Stachybotrys chlorohalonatus (strain IBT 40285) TaxID=1283841 RepID=A0A084Q8T6_STAC4|nr:hypothetical protein S40285_08611 [Stachybotrys chlorohalonata IBT 40285]
MCFGGKDERGDEPAPKPVPLQHRQEDTKKSSPPPFVGSNSGGGPSSAPAAAPAAEGGGVFDYAPPAGPPPPPQQQQTVSQGYAPPAGPPPPASYGQSQDDFAPPAGPPPGSYGWGQSQSQSQNEYTAPMGPPPSQLHGGFDYAPPPGPPPPGPSPPVQQQDYAPPSMPPPGKRQDDYGSPPGPPPAGDWAAPPPGPPPPAASADPKHDWEVAVPDTSLFPPPPAIFSGFDRSPSSNAPEEEADAGEDWCQRYPLTQPILLDATAKSALQQNNIRLMEPAGFSGKLSWLGTGRWQVQTLKNSPDRCIISYPPLYAVSEHDPTRFGVPKTIYYEVKIRGDSPTVYLAMGFSALPYPSFRMPGWHRGSLAVHGDDGHKYINDRWGGKSFTDEFRRGDTYGIGMRLAPSGGTMPQVTIFFTKNGAPAGEWDLHEETDAEQDLPVTGLEGFHDLCCSVGTYDGIYFDVVFEPSQWLYKGVQ